MNNRHVGGDNTQGSSTVNRTDLGRTIAAIACTLVMSVTCIVGAVGPAQAGRATSTAQRTIA